MRTAPFLLLLMLSAARAQPTIAAVTSAADYTDGASTGLPRGGIFTIFGSGLALSALPAGAPPLATVLNGVRVRIWDSATAGRLVAECPLYYVSPTQINAVLPSSTPDGPAYLSVSTASQETQRQPFTAIAGRFAAFARGATGFAAIQQYPAPGQPVLNALSAAAEPGAIMALWGTGLAPLASGSDADAPTAGTLRTDVTIYVAGLPATPVYAGRAPGLPGVDQINFKLPQGIPESCFVPLVVQTGSLKSAGSTLSVAPSGGNCGAFGLSAGALSALDAGGLVRGAVLLFTSISYASSGLVTQTADAWIADYDAASIAALAADNPQPSTPDAATCTRTAYSYTLHGGGPPASSLTGVRVIAPAALSATINGAGPSAGCQWAVSDLGNSIFHGAAPASCLARSYAFSGLIGTNAFGGVASTLPQPRPASAGFTVRNSGEQSIASWTGLSLEPNDRVLLMTGSYFNLPGNIFDGLTYVRQETCQTSPANTPFTIPDAAWALSLAYPSPVSFTLSSVRDDVWDAAGSPVDFILVRIRNSVSAGAPAYNP